VAYDIAPVAIHAPYLINLAGPDETFFARSISVLVHDLRAAPGFRARYFNVHIGSHMNTGVAVGVARVADGIRLALSEVDDGADTTMIVLENAAGSGYGLGCDLPELGAIAEAIDARGVRSGRVGFCLDTAHAWGAGIDVGDPVATDRFLDDFDALIGLDRLVMIHLNDSKAERGSRLDRHEHVGAGKIGPAGLAHLLCHPSLAHVTFFLETPGMDEGYDAVNIARAHDLMAGRPLAVLPPEAMTVRGSRSRTGPSLGPAE
jgi:deoxyribonuclease-4